MLGSIPFTWFDLLLIGASLVGPWAWGATAVLLFIRSYFGDLAARVTLATFIPQSLIVLLLWIWLGNSRSGITHQVMALILAIVGISAWWMSWVSIKRGTRGFIHVWPAWTIFLVALTANGSWYRDQYRDMRRSSEIEAAVNALRAGRATELKADCARMDDFMRRDFLQRALGQSLDETAWRRLVESGIDPFYSTTVQHSPYASDDTGIGIAISELNFPAVAAFVADVKRAPEMDARRNALLGENPLPGLLDQLDDPDKGPRSRAIAEFLVQRYPTLTCAKSTDIGASAACDSTAGTLVDRYVESGHRSAVQFLLQHGDVISKPLAVAGHALLGNKEALVADIRGNRTNLLAKIGDITLGEYAIEYGSMDLIQALMDSGLIPWPAFDRLESNGSGKIVNNLLLDAALQREMFATSDDSKMRGLVAHMMSAMIAQKAIIADWQIAYAFHMLYDYGSKRVVTAIGPDISCDRLRAAVRASFDINWSSAVLGEVDAACT
ncbi:hypothetical protein WL80_05750 [Burkholderia ubonensis]|uniref:hypothetical protein n=1 Tax=Burkholderia ubonensis TaxID=101571 RepID=UPI000752AFB3|nr:hypothetical protein [Burkholderia ubonensis]KWE96295.1 hypothetical protein WL80_05750 [Burkholderia ubonensis]